MSYLLQILVRTADQRLRYAQGYCHAVLAGPSKTGPAQQGQLLVGQCQWCGPKFEPGRGQNSATDYCPAQNLQEQQPQQQWSSQGQTLQRSSQCSPQQKEQLGSPLQQQQQEAATAAAGIAAASISSGAAQGAAHSSSYNSSTASDKGPNTVHCQIN